MKNHDLRKLKLFEALANPDILPSQRELARRLNVSVGLINAFVKRLVKKGYIKVSTIPKNRVRYLLTPKGLIEKSRLTYLYIHNSYIYYRKACNKLEDLFSRLQNEGVGRIAFYGLSDVAELTHHVLQESEIIFAGIIDEDHAGELFAGEKIHSIAEIKYLEFDRLLITDFKKVKILKNRLKNDNYNFDWIYL